MKPYRRRFLQCAVGITASSTLPCLAAPALAGNVSTRVYSGPAFGTHWRLVLGTDQYPDAALKSIERLLAQIDASISPYREDSILSRFNRSVSGTSTKIAPDILRLIHTSVVIADQSHGAFDPTVGPLVNRFGFGPIEGSEHLDYRDVQYSRGELFKDKTGLTLDLCGLGKGYAVDRISQSLQQQGYQHFLFEIGGEFVGVGRHPAGRPWVVAIESENDAQTQNHRVPLLNSSMATSGLQHNRFIYKDKLYGHLIDKENNASAEPRCHSVTVLHSSATLADAWSTALFVAGPQRGAELARQNELSAYFMAINSAHGNAIRTGTFLDQTIEG